MNLSKRRSLRAGDYEEGKCVEVEHEEDKLEVFLEVEEGCKVQREPRMLMRSLSLLW